MKRTGPTTEITRKLIRLLEKTSVTQKNNIWKTVAGLVSKPRRQRASVNVQKLGRLSRKFAKKTMLIPGKILSGGILATPINVAALEYSENAKQKIKAAKGNAWTLPELLESKIKPSEIVIVK